MPLSPQRLSATTRASLARGAALYDAGLYWESHEAWEEAWLVEEGDARVLLQGLIQVAAGFHKAIVQRQPSGCVKLLSTGLDKLRSVPADLAGSELAAFIGKVEAALREAVRWQAGEVAGVARGSIPALGPDFSVQPWES
jgi:predicted metal-dependent hydrolase